MQDVEARDMDGQDVAATNADIVPVVLSGGSGTRLWPLSRARYPKQFVSRLNGSPDSLLTATLRRLEPRHGFARPIVICNEAHRFLVREHAAAAGIAPQCIVLEPVPRNTAPAVTIAALLAARRDPSALLAVMPSDHAIDDCARFSDAVRAAAAVARQGHIVLFGIRPTEPHTGYGYIRAGDALPGAATEVFEVTRFLEKPDAKTAAALCSDGGYLWNSGIFVMQAAAYLEEVARHAAPILSAAERALDGAEDDDLGFLRLAPDPFSAAPDISVDYAILEKTTSAVVLPLPIGWSDLGSWSSLWQSAPHDAAGNHVEGDAVLEDTRDCYIRTESSLVSTIGVSDLIIVETPDSVLVADKSRASEVARTVARLKAAGRKEPEHHIRSHRPWGYFDTLSTSPRFQVKLLHVRPGAMLSMQRHRFRSEHWVVVQGTARVTIEGVARIVRENESADIAATQWHRLENAGNTTLELIEVQMGTYLGEDDIERRDDAYARRPDEIH